MTTRQRFTLLQMNPLDLIEVDVIATLVTELRGTCRCMVGHCRRVFERAAVFQINGDADRTKCVIADLGIDAGRERPAPHHRVGVGLWQGVGAQAPGTALNGAKQRLFCIGADPGTSM
jgi:hypothetical protein